MMTDIKGINMKKAFTILELVFVIVVLGILAALAVPRLDRDLRQEAADNVLSAIRYTQHLALVDDKHKFDKSKWQRRFWRLYFGVCDSKPFYAIGTDDNMDGSSNARVDIKESPLAPANGKHIWAHDGATCEGSHNLSDISPDIFLGKKYGITSITHSGGCSTNFIGFDHLGRPYTTGFQQSTKPDNSGYMTTKCTFTFALSDGTSFSISIEPETGHAYIVGQPNS